MNPFQGHSSPHSSSSGSDEAEGNNMNRSMVVCESLIEELTFAKLKKIKLSAEEEKLLQLVLDLLDLHQQIELIPEDAVKKDLCTFLRWLIHTKMQLFLYRKKEEFLRNLFKLFAYFRRHHLDKTAPVCHLCGDIAALHSACEHQVLTCINCAKNAVFACDAQACEWTSDKHYMVIKRQQAE